MATRRDPRFKECRRFGLNVYGHPKALKRVKKEQRQKKMSEYGTQLLEKQKLRAYYNLLERQFVRYYDRAKKMEGVTGENMLKLLECRLDNIVYRLGFARTRAQARQLVNHGHILVDGKKVDIPSYRLSAGQKVSLTDAAKKFVIVTSALEATVSRPEYVSYDENSFTGSLVRVPERDEFLKDINEQLIVEIYNS